MPTQHAFRSDLLVLYARSSLTPATGRLNWDGALGCCPGPARSQWSERSDGAGDDERYRFGVLQYSTRIQDNPATSDEVPGRSEAT